MKFEQSLKDAIIQHKEQNKILLLLIEGPDKCKCEYLEECINKLDSEKFPNITAVKLDFNSQHYLDFQNLYTHLEFSCLVFIGENGVPMKILMIPSDQFNKDKINLKVHDMADYCNCISEAYKYFTDRKEIFPEKKRSKLVELDNKNLETRIKFKLPDGSARFHTFRSEASIEEMRIFILEEIKPPYKFNLATMNPFRILPFDCTDTFLQMDLYPSAVILLLPPKKRSGATDVVHKAVVLFWILIYMISNTFWYISDTFFWIGERTTDWIVRNVFRRRQARTPRIHTLFGNVHTLQTDDSDSNDENTYNGNSTQQK